MAIKHARHRGMIPNALSFVRIALNRAIGQAESECCIGSQVRSEDRKLGISYSGVCLSFGFLNGFFVALNAARYNLIKVNVRIFTVRTKLKLIQNL